MEIDYQDLGRRIKRKREAVGLSQAELAFRVDLSPQHISNVENARGRIGLKKLVTIANTLHCTMDELICGSTLKVRNVYHEEISEMLEDMSDAEIRALPEFLRIYNYMFALLVKRIEKIKE